MNSISSCGEGYVQPVVDQHFRADQASGGDGLPGEIGQCSCAQVFFPDLNQLAADGGGLAEGFDLCAPSFVFAAVSFAAERLAVGDQIK